MTNKKELDINELNNIEEKVESVKMKFLYNLGESVEKVAFDVMPPRKVIFTVTARGYYKNSENPCYYLKPHGGIGTCHPGWYHEDSVNSANTWTSIPDWRNVTKIDGEC